MSERLKHWGPDLNPLYLMEKDGAMRWVPLDEEEKFLADGWEHPQDVKEVPID